MFGIQALTVSLFLKKALFLGNINHEINIARENPE